MNNKKVFFKKVIKKSSKIVHKIHRNLSRTAKSHRNVYDESLEGENSLKNTNYLRTSLVGLESNADACWSKLTKRSH